VAALAQAALRLTALLLSVVSGIIIARKLPPSGYAAYQAAMKRASLIASLPLILVGFWGYRYIAAGRRGSLRASIILSLVAGAAAALVAAWLVLFLGGGPLLAVVAAAAILVYSVYDGAGRALAAARSVYVEASRLVYRIVYAALVVLLVYAASMGAVGAATAALLGAGLGLLYLLRGARGLLGGGGGCLRCIGEWLRGSWIPVMYWLTSLLLGLDVVVAGAILGSEAVAAFFAAAVIASMSMEAALAAAVHVQAHVLRTGDTASGYSVACLLALLSAPLYAYMAARPEQVVALMNPRYVYASGCLIAYSAASYTAILYTAIQQVVQGTDTSTASKPGPVLRLVAAWSLAGSAAYIGLLAAVLLALHGSPIGVSLTAWGVCLLLGRLIQLIGVSRVAAANGAPVPGSLAIRAALYPLLALPAALLLAPRGYAERFLADALLAAKGLAVTAAAYAALVLLLDPWARGLAGRGLSRLKALHIWK